MILSGAEAIVVNLEDIDSGLTSPTGNYRWLDVADQLYSDNYRNSYDYTQANVEVTYTTPGSTLNGTVSATNLKPNFAYQLKLVGNSGSSANFRIGLAGRWWQEEWNGSQWTNGQNLNNKGVGTSPNPNDLTYFSRRDTAYSTNPTVLKYDYTAYLVFGYFITDGNGNTSFSFETSSSYHVLWKTSQQTRTDADGPLEAVTFDADLSAAYADTGGDDYTSQAVSIFGEWERLPGGGVFLLPGDYSGQIILTEESFHGSGGEFAGSWAGAMGATIQFGITPSPATSGFVGTNGMQLTLNDAPYFFAGTNYWYGINLSMIDSNGDRARLSRELDQLKDLGITNLRVMAGSEGPNSEPWRMVPALQTGPGVYDPLVLDGLDYLLYAMNQRNIRAVMCLTNFWPWSGGMAQYVNWNGAVDIPYPPPHEGGNWGTYQAYTAGFFLNPGAMSDYQNHIDYLIHRINPYTGLAYKDDPTIMTWELANEPRGIGNAAQFNLWIDSTAAFIKASDANHLVTTGCEGDTPWPLDNGLDFLSNHNGSNIDYATIHIFPQNWGWYDPADPAGTYSTAENNARTYFNGQISKAVSLNKPAVLEEFGLARDGGSYNPITATIQRDLFFTAMYEEVYASANSGGSAAGTNFWAWAGEGRPLSPYGSYWSPLDPWTGDPPHEKQGWYSVYDADSTTLAVISNHSSAMNSLIDADGDGVPDDTDNCPNTPNGSGGGACTPDSDNPGANCTDRAPCINSCTSNGDCSMDQEDVDGDGVGDVCDNCPNKCNVDQWDADTDEEGDVCDPDPGCGGCDQPECELECGT
jgi:mannan endo-1,4-beta-mannosidase